MNENSDQKTTKSFIGSNNFFGENGIFNDLVKDVHNNLNIEIINSSDEKNQIPQMFNIWIEARKKLTEKELNDLCLSLQSSYFCSNEDIAQVLYEIESFGKFKIAVLPKIYTSNFIKDLKFALKNQSNILINLNEHPC
jgi:hypothetical protein